MAESDSFEDVGHAIGVFYDASRKGKAAPDLGQIVFCPVQEHDSRPMIGDVRRQDSILHSEITMQIREQVDGDFRGKDDRLPVKGLSLERTQEIILTKAKLRPCLVVGASNGVDAESFPEGIQKRFASKAFGPMYLLAPIFSISTSSAPGTFGPIASARIRCLMYPQFFFLRQSGGFLPHQSVARLDRVFVRAPHPGSGFNPADLFLDEKLIALVKQQFLHLLGHQLPQEFVDLRELMLTCLPDMAKPA